VLDDLASLNVAKMRERLPKGSIVWKEFQNISDGHSSRNFIRFTLFFVCLTAMFMTSSRAGVTISLLGMVGAFIIFFA